MPKINSRQKGASGEREAAKFLRGIGFTSAQRGQQHAGGYGTPDVKCPDLSGVLLEIKRVEAMNLGSSLHEAACSRAAQDAKEKPWAVLWRKNRGEWLLTFFSKELDMPVTVAGPARIERALRRLQSAASEDAALRGTMDAPW